MLGPYIADTVGARHASPFLLMRRRTSHLRQSVRLAILFRQKRIGFFVIPESLGLGIESDVTAQLRGDVSQMADRRAQAAEFHVRIGFLAAFDAVQEVLRVRAA